MQLIQGLLLLLLAASQAAGVPAVRMTCEGGMAVVGAAAQPPPTPPQPAPPFPPVSCQHPLRPTFVMRHCMPSGG